MSYIILHMIICGMHAARAFLDEEKSIRQGRTIRQVRCEQCGRSFGYELCRTASSAEDLSWALAKGIELVPCPTCGWYQASMIPKARRQHGRWMLIVGWCLTVGLIPVGFLGGFINAVNEQRGAPSIPTPVLVGVLASLGVVGVGLMIAKFLLARRYDPNAQDVEARKRLGESRAIPPTRTTGDHPGVFCW